MIFIYLYFYQRFYLFILINGIKTNEIKNYTIITILIIFKKLLIK